MKTIIALAGCGLLLAACAPDHLPVDDAGRTTIAPLASAPVDTCGASRMQNLVGKPKSQISVPADLSKQQVACTTCVLPQTFDPTRVTILFDQSNGLVSKVICQ